VDRARRLRERPDLTGDAGILERGGDHQREHRLLGRRRRTRCGDLVGTAEQALRDRANSRRACNRDRVRTDANLGDRRMRIDARAHEPRRDDPHRTTEELRDPRSAGAARARVTRDRRLDRGLRARDPR
jgi:hypothetical protein